MSLRHLLSVLFSIVVALSAAPLVAADTGAWGDLTGKFIFDGQAPEQKPIASPTAECASHKPIDEALVVGKDGGIADIFVYLRTKKPAVHPDYEKTAKDELTLDNKNCRFEPHTLVLRTGQTLKVKNSDTFGHNTKLDPRSPSNVPSNVLLPAGAEADAKYKGEETLPFQVGCNIHPWMGGWILVREDPYAVTSGKDGSFTIKNVPAGKELEFQFWHAKSGYLKDVQMKGAKADTKGRFKFTVKPGTNDLGDIKVSAKLFAK